MSNFHVTFWMVTPFWSVALNCTIVLEATFCGIGVICKVSCAVPEPMVSLGTADKLTAKFASPEYCAVSGCVPAVSVAVLNVAIPLLPNGMTPLESGVPLSRKVTFPVGIPLVELLTVAVI